MDIIPAIVARSGSCSIQVEDVFGPQVKGCLDDFDFTLLFEECIMTVPLTALLLLVTVPRIRFLFGTSDKANGGVHYFSKVVRIHPQSRSYCDNTNVCIDWYGSADCRTTCASNPLGKTINTKDAMHCASSSPYCRTLTTINTSIAPRT